MLAKKTFRSYIRQGQFDQLFITELGWTSPSSRAPLPPIDIEGVTYQPRPVASLADFRVLICDVEAVPATTACRKLDLKIRKYTNEYLCIFVARSEELHHLWMTPVRKIDKRDIVLTEYVNEDQSDAIYAKIEGISFGFNETPTISDVRERINASFIVNSEKITKDFYAGFKKEHTAFTSFITGIDDNIADKNNRNKQWYASVMLNRLMFCYFIQKKGFLDDNKHYLREKLEWSRQERGHNQFFKGFYLSFLKQLFHDGLNAPKHDDEFEQVYGRVPYLNGGMFDEHPIEHDYAQLDIADEAFERLFAFFDKWNWHLDTRITASGKDINPDVLGYIFEQYINDRAQMGAYYTKEDITEYIGRNCIVPYLFDEVAKASARDFEPTGYVWQRLRASGDRYLFDAVKQGYSADWRSRIPENIEVGIDTSKPNLLGRRKDWNGPTDAAFALPTEIWRESIERLQRCDDILGRIERGEITSITDFITYNLDIRQFAHDLLAKATDHKFVLHFYHALQRVTILDPTCGSGAFLFAALNILEPLYEVCIDRMQEFNAENKNLFTAELAEISHKYRSNIQYFIYKSIILRNLYGVDIMVEATEIAKLRLFLKMVAVVDVDRRSPNLGLDPLPDIDFNIRCGNTLVGYATEEELNRDLNSDTDLLQMIANQEFKATIDEEMAKVAAAYEVFKSVQLNQAEDMVTFKHAKHELAMRLKSLNEKLNKKLHSVSNTISYDDWLRSHQPFHWLAEFYQIIQGNGGFDVIVGNPPYVEYFKKNSTTKTSVSDTYKINWYNTIDCGNLYAYVIERCVRFSNTTTKMGFIIPSASICTPRMSALTKVLQAYGSIWSSIWDERPSKLFDGVDQQLCIHLLSKDDSSQMRITRMTHWSTECRKQIFQLIGFCNYPKGLRYAEVLPKTQCKIELDILQKLNKGTKTIPNLLAGADEAATIYYKNAGGRYWRLVKSFPTFFKSATSTSTSTEKSMLIPKEDVPAVVTSLSSSLFYWYWRIVSNCRHLTNREIDSFMFIESLLTDNSLAILFRKFENDLKKNARRSITQNGSSGEIVQDFYYVRLSKPIIDSIDSVLAKHYGFTEEELDFIINYDIKYRMGDELNTEE